MNKDCVEVSTEQRPMTFSEQLQSLAKLQGITNTTKGKEDGTTICQTIR